MPNKYQHPFLFPQKHGEILKKTSLLSWLGKHLKEHEAKQFYQSFLIFSLYQKDANAILWKVLI